MLVAKSVSTFAYVKNNFSNTKAPLPQKVPSFSFEIKGQGSLCNMYSSRAGNGQSDIVRWIVFIDAPFRPRGPARSWVFLEFPGVSSQLTTCKHQIKKRIRFLSCKSRDTWAVSHRDTWCPVKENTLVISARHRLCGKHVESTNQRQEMTAWYTNVTSLNKEITLHSRNRSTRDFVTRFQLWVKVTSAMK